VNADSIMGNAGSDTISGGGGADTLNGGEGNDTYQFSSAANLTAGRISDASGSNTISMTAADVITDAEFVNKTGVATLTLSGNPNNVTLDDDALAAGITTVNAAANGDTITVTAGYTGAITIVGGAGNDAITSGAGSDRITLGGGVDNVNGGAGDDTFVGGANLTDAGGGAGTEDTIIGGSGNDTLTLAGDYNLAATTAVSGIETYTLQSQGVSNTAVGAGGTNGYTYNIDVDNENDPNNAVVTDTLTVDASGLLADANSVDAGAQAETLDFTAAGTTFFKVNVTGGAANDIIVGGTLADTLTGGDGDDQLTGGAGADVLSGGNGVDNISGGDDNDTILGGVGADVINGGAGNDSIEAGSGLDQLTGGAGADTFVLTSTVAADADTITDFALGAGGDTLQLDLLDLGLAGSDVFLGAAHQVDATGSQEIVVLNFASYASDAAAAAAVADSVTTDGNAVVIIYHNNGDNNDTVRVIRVTNSNTGTGVTHIATLDVDPAGADDLVDLATAVAGNFGGRP